MPKKAAAKKTEDATIHIGAMLSSYLQQQGIRPSPLGRAMGMSYERIRVYRTRPSLQSYIIAKLSHALRHNFFADMAAMLPASYSTDAPIDTSKEQELQEVKQQLALVTAERDVLLRALGRGV